jgi:Tfp pilus assembly protein PilF
MEESVFLNLRFNQAYLLVIGLMFLNACSSKKNEISLKQSGIYHAAGTQSLMNGEYTDALKNLLEANKLDPENTDIINNLGMAYYFKGETVMAITQLKRALKLNKNNSDAKVNLASIQLKSGDFNSAEKLYKEVLRDLTYEKQARTLYNLGILEIEGRKNSVAAENYFTKSIKEDDNYCPSYFQMGLIQFNRRQYSRSLKNFKEASMGTCFESPAPHYYQALSLMQLGRYMDARLKLDEIETRFKRSVYAVKARSKILEIDELEQKKSSESVATSERNLPI